MKKLTAGVCFCAISAFLILADAVAGCAYALYAQADKYGFGDSYMGALEEYLPVFAIIFLIIGMIYIVWSIVEEIVNKKKRKTEVTDEQ